jgi:hypothetical protein
LLVGCNPIKPPVEYDTLLKCQTVLSLEGDNPETNCKATGPKIERLVDSIRDK